VVKQVILTVPTVTPVTIPVALPTVAIDVFELLQLTPDVASLRVIELPEQDVEGPVIAAGEVPVVTVTLPVIVRVHAVVELVATMV